MERGSTTPTWSGTAAVVCRGKDAAPPMLKEALLRRGFVVEEAETTYQAIGRAVLLGRQSADGRVVVVLVEPAKLGRPHELVAALSSSTPGAVCWLCRKTAEGMELRGVTEADLSGWQVVGKASVVAAVSAAAVGASGITPIRPSNEPAAGAYEEGAKTPSLRLAGDWQGSAAEVPRSGATELPPPVLTDEELAMLLGDDTSAAEPGN
ncbi:MAG: hypothetical protein J0L78_15560 [Planctomycetes bacterium]|nr:hypothetical protein [Planctomycetota bacterium]